MKKPIAYAEFWHSAPDMPHHSSHFFWADARSIEDGKTMFDHYGYGVPMAQEYNGQWRRVVALTELDGAKEE